MTPKNWPSFRPRLEYSSPRYLGTGGKLTPESADMDKDLSDAGSESSSEQCKAINSIPTRKRKDRPESAGTNGPKLGIIFYARNKLFIDGTPLKEASDYGDFKIHDKGHDAYWEELVGAHAVPGGEFDEFPRGRVVYDTRTRRFTLYLDRCILAREDVVKKIMKRMRLPKTTAIDGDLHYRCAACMRKLDEDD